jgi:hypothetical protein
MEWILIRILGGVIASLGCISIFLSEDGFMKGTPSFGALILTCIGAFIYLSGTKKQSESDINEFYTQKGYSIEEAGERTKLTVKILKERNVWPKYGLDELISAERQVNSYLKKEK